MRWAIRAIAVACAVGSAPAAVFAQQCAHKPIKATGSPAILESAAHSRARTAWIARVKASRKLGPSYAVWLRAENPSYACRKSGKYRVCDATATPCKI